MGMMKMIGKVGRKFRTAYMKSSRPKTGWAKPISDDLRSANQAMRQRNLIRDQGVADFSKATNLSDVKTGTAMKKHFIEAEQARSAKVAKRVNDYDAGYPKSPSAKKKPIRVSFKGQDMQERNFMKSFKTVGGYKYGTIVSKKAARTQGVGRAVRDASAFEGGTKRNWAKNYKTRNYQP
jgi:hypothetical protein